ncbi:MAG TPA: aminotransferase class V-fold PLP-dependent enzyme [Chloroflexia bacterium]|nr:aminotransferase class V-fold PLP-dependent enzyme [Chloroflexia bacterium]
MVTNTDQPVSSYQLPATTFEWTTEELKHAGYRVVDMIAEHLTGLPDGPVFQPVAQALAEQFLGAPLPGEGQSIDAIFDDFARDVAPYPFGNGHPRFYGWVNSPPTPITIFAEALAAAMNPSCAGGNHAAVYVEHCVLNWFREILRFPPESMGLLVSGGSMANLTALAVARHVKAGIDVRADGLQQIEKPLVLYMGEEGHGCIRKAAELMGIGSRNIRTISSDEHRRMSVPDLEAAIRADLEAGYRPIAVAASAGAVNHGAIDPLDDIADMCERYGLWFHVDGAYGAPAVLTEQYRPQLEALSRADSVALDPHKWFYIPVEVGLVMVRDGAAMRDTFSLVPPYLRTDGSLTGVGGPTWFSEYGFQQTRGFRALKVWMALKHHGTEGYRQSIERDISLAQHLAALVEASSDMQMLAPQSLSIVCFRYAPPELRDDNERLNALNKTLLEKIQLGGQAFISGTVLSGDRFALRACIVNHRATAADMDFLVGLVRSIGEELARDA